ncbi:hypothetical protein ABZ543_34505 [Streptomyces roseifaciens]
MSRTEPTEAASTAEAVGAAGLRGSSAVSRFTTEISTTRGVEDSWESGYSLSFGYRWPRDSALPVPVVLLDTLDCSQETSVVPRENDQLELIIDITDLVDFICEVNPGMYLKCRATLTTEGTAFTGGVTTTCDDMELRAEVPYAWRSTGVGPGAAETIRALRSLATAGML